MISMSEIETFKTTVETFIAEKKITPTHFGKKYAGDPLFVFQLREGREPRTKTRKRVMEAISQSEAAQ
jgi:predicted transcriptional regulator